MIQRESESMSSKNLLIGANEMGEKFRVYVASSLRNNLYKRVIRDLRMAGFSVFDFSDPKGREVYPKLTVENKVWKEHYGIELDRLDSETDSFGIIGENYTEITTCDFLVLVLPCGLDSHVDFGISVGLGKPSYVVGSPDDSKITVTHLFSESIHETVESLIETLKEDWLS